MASSVGDAVIGICSDIIEELVNCHQGVFRSCSLSRSNCAKCSKEFVVHCSGVVEEGADDSLDPFDTVVVERWACINGGASVLFFCAIYNFTMLVRGVDRFCWGWMVIACTDIIDVTGHGGAAGAVSVIPLDVDARKFGTRPIGGDVVGLAECIKEVFGVVFAHILDTEVIDNEDKKYGSPLVTEEPRRSIALIIPMRSESLDKEIIGKFTSLLETVDSLGDFEVYPAVVDVLHEVVFVNVFLWNDVEFYSRIFFSIKWCF